MNCWEYMNCGDKKDKCPAHPHGGEKCWRINDTMCHGPSKVRKFVDKVEECKICKFYQLAHKK